MTRADTRVISIVWDVPDFPDQLTGTSFSAFQPWNAFAFCSRGRDEDGNLVHDRLFILENDETVVERVTMESSELKSETIEQPTSSG